MINGLLGVGFTRNISRIVGVSAVFITQSPSAAPAPSSGFGSGFMRAEAGARPGS